MPPRRDDADFGGAAADVDHHRARRFAHRQAGADGRGHRLFDQVDLAGAGAERRLADRAALDLRGAAGHADDDARARLHHRARVDHLDELLEHLLGDGEVGDDAVLHRADGRRCCRAPCPSIGFGLGAHRLDRSSCRWGRPRGGSRRPTARRGRCPCRARRSACWRCRGRWPGRWRNSGAGIRTCLVVQFNLAVGRALRR